MGSNDGSFNTGNGFNDAIIIARHIAVNSVDGHNLTASAIKLGITEITTGTITHNNTLTTIASLTVTVPAGGRDVELEIVVPQLYSTVVNDRVNIKFMEGSTVLEQYYNGLQLATGGAISQIFKAYVPAPSAGTHTYFVTGIRDIGTGTVGWYNDNIGSTLLLVAKLI